MKLVPSLDTKRGAEYPVCFCSLQLTAEGLEKLEAGYNLEVVVGAPVRF